MNGLATVAFAVALSLPEGVSRTTLVAGVMLVVGLVILVASGRRSRAWMKKLGPRRERPAPASIEARVKAAKGKRAHEDELAGLIHDVREVTRMCATQMDQRAAKLERLLERADTTIDRLLTLANSVDTSQQVRHQAEVSVRRVTPAPARTLEAEPMDPLAKQVCALAQAGRSPVEIASELEEQVGKVELILALQA